MDNSMNSTSTLYGYPIPEGVPVLKDFRVRVRIPNQEWVELGTYRAKIDMHDVREASVAYFDFCGQVECEVTALRESVRSVEIRPRSSSVDFTREGDVIRFFLDRPAMLSVEINGDRFHNLHLFAENPLKAEKEDKNGEQNGDQNGDQNEVCSCEGGGQNLGITVVEPGENELDLESILEKAARTGGRRVVRLQPGLHRLKENRCSLPSDATVIICGGAVVMGSFLVYNKNNITITGRGMIYLGHVKKETYLRGADISSSENIVLEGVTIMNPAHYSVHLGNSRNVQIRNIKAFSCEGWSDGIDMMACQNILIENVFLRNSDDCIAIYGGRFKYPGNTRNVTVRGAVLWADVAHPTMIGVHGDADKGGSIIENISFEEIDILEHHEPQDDYLGCMTINAGDDNTVRNISYRNIRVEQFERGKLLDIQVKWNKKYNDVPGKQIENIMFENVDYSGSGEHTSEIRGLDEDRRVKGVRIRNLTVRGVHVQKPEDGNLHIGEYADDITFE